MGRTVLVTGANGFVGQSLCRQLIGDGYKVIPMTHHKVGLPQETVIDFEDPKFGEKLSSLPKVEAVIHLGAKVDFSPTAPKDLFLKANVSATEQLASWAKKTGAYFIFSSAAIICGGENPLITSQSAVKPDGPYIHSKYLGEEAITASGVKNAILRIGGIFGKNGPVHLGINNAIASALKGNTVILRGRGKAKRNYIYVEDLSRSIQFCLEKRIEGTHLVAGSFVNTVAEMLGTICGVLSPGQKPKQEIGPDGKDQIIEASSVLPKGRTFEDAIKDIKETAK